MADKVKIVHTGVSFTSLLFLTLFVLKLCNVINWSWWIITMPLWLPFALFLVTVVLFLIGLAVVFVVVKSQK